jgi:hypothetical protein
VVGRICCDADAKLNEASILLESSRVMGSGVRVPLRFDAEVKLRAPTAGRSGIGLFPGAIVALKGKNGGGGRFNVSEIWTVCRAWATVAYTFWTDSIYPRCLHCQRHRRLPPLHHSLEL